LPLPDSTPEQFKIHIAETRPGSPLLIKEISPRSGRVIQVPIGDQNDPQGYVELSSGPNFKAEALATTGQAFLLAAVAASFVALLVGLFVSRGLTAPLCSLSATAGQMSDGDLSVRAPVPGQGQGEIGQLARQFNQMAARLEASFAEVAAERDTLRRFIADASHELRTPITALRNINELLQGPAANDSAAQQEFLTESETQLKRLEWITQNLLNLSRLEAGLVALDLVDCEVRGLLDIACVTFNAIAQEKGIDLSIKALQSPIFIRGDRTEIEMALSNLLDNALKFTPAGGQVELGAEFIPTPDGSTEPSVQIWVKDNGPGIDPVDRPRLFERFYRGQNTHQVTGSGLGLAIVQSIVQAHGGQVWVESMPGAGSRFVIELAPARSKTVE
jgi:two-component system OmpR family sensor kinase